MATCRHTVQGDDRGNPHCRDEDYALALVDGAFTKAIVVQLVRKVEGKQFYEVPLSLPFLC